MKVLRHITACLLLAALCLPLCAQKNQKTLQGNKDRKARLERDIRLLEKQVDAITAQSGSAAAQLDLLHVQTQARRELLQESEHELGVVSDSVRVCTRQIKALEARLDTMSRYYSRLVRSAYKHRDARVWYLYILASENLGQGMRRYGYLRQLSSRMNAQGREMRSEHERLELKRAHLDSLKAEARKLRDERASEVNKLRKEEDKSRALVAQLQQDKRKYQDQLNKKRREVEALNREIERMIADAMGGKGGNGGKGGKKTNTKIDEALSGEFAANKGKLPWPVEGRVVSHFGRNPHPVYTRLEMPFNNGVGIAVDKDAPVTAVFTGVVKQIVVIPGYNQCILVQHGAYFTFYCKMGSVAVKAGDKVKTGDTLGHASSASDAQIHFQLWKGREAQDPETWLRK
ncbi:MAG: peptidoglycan DD-metalloendopeptidase family protein [Bacteroidales bacterium]|nr:peptidoglycan DD-metalloendopeptidase family protein [Bacteroidales bacterium]